MRLSTRGRPQPLSVRGRCGGQQSVGTERNQSVPPATRVPWTLMESLTQPQQPTRCAGSQGALTLAAQAPGRRPRGHVEKDRTAQTEPSGTPAEPWAPETVSGEIQKGCRPGATSKLSFTWATSTELSAFHRPELGNGAHQNL